MSVPYVIITGDSDGLGNAVARAILRCSDNVRVLGVSRRADAEVVGYDQLSPSERARYVRVRTDLSSPNDVARALGEIFRIVATESGRVRALLLVNGTGFLDSEVRADPALGALMEQLNVHTPVAFALGVEEHSDLAEAGMRVFYYSGLSSHPKVGDRLSSMHAALKSEAAAQLRAICHDQLTCVMPGAYMTPTLARTLVRHDSSLELYALPVSDPYERGGITDVVAKLVVSRSRAPRTLIRPHISKLVVRKGKSGALAALPAAIVRSARAVLEQTGQSDESHDARVSYLQEHKIYGEDFPYDSIRSEHLWPRWASLAYARVLDGLALTR